MLLPFDLRADREGWTVFEIATDEAASLDGLPLTGLCLEDAEDAVNALNRLEIATAGVKRARWWTFPTPQELPAFEGNLALTTQHALGTAPPLDKAA